MKFIKIGLVYPKTIFYYLQPLPIYSLLLQFKKNALL